MYRHSKHNLTPANSPSMEALSAACKVLNDHQLAVYQRLYAVGLTAPGFPSSPFQIRRSIDHLACIEVSLNQRNIADNYAFKVRTLEEIDDVVRKCELIAEAADAEKKKIHSHACCPLAEFRPCVCDVSFKCPIHGSMCHGSHD